MAFSPNPTPATIVALQILKRRGVAVSLVASSSHAKQLMSKLPRGFWLAHCDSTEEAKNLVFHQS